MRNLALAAVFLFLLSSSTADFSLLTFAGFVADVVDVIGILGAVAVLGILESKTLAISSRVVLGEIFGNNSCGA